MLAATPGVPAGTGLDDLAANYQETIKTGMEQQPCCFPNLENVVQAGPTEYDTLPDGALRPRTFDLTPEAYDTDRFDHHPTVAAFYGVDTMPWLAGDVSFRPLRKLALPQTESAPMGSWKPVGSFDPDRLTGFADLSRVPLETYVPPVAPGADERSRQALGGQPLQPGGNPGGYLSPPPMLLTNLASVPKLLAGGRARSSARRSAPSEYALPGSAVTPSGPRNGSGWSPSRSPPAPGSTWTSPSARPRPPRPSNSPRALSAVRACGWRRTGPPWAWRR